MIASKKNRNQQCKKWEKERRDRLNDSFNSLAKLLPCYEPSGTISKIDILTKSADYIIKLKSNVTLFNTENQHNLEYEEIKELHLRVTHLTKRNEQLSNLLKDANITIPHECGEQLKEKLKKWSGKLSTEDAQEINNSSPQKENQISPIKPNIGKAGKFKPIKLQQIKKKKAKRKAKKNHIATVTSSGTSMCGPCSKLTITNVQPIQPYYIIANNVASTITTQATSVKTVITTPIISTSQNNKTFASGVILPVVQSQTLLNPSLLLNAATPANTLFVVKTKKTEPISSNIKTLESNSTNTLNIKNHTKIVNKVQTQKKMCLLRPKRRLGNKIQLPSKYDNSFILCSGSPPVSVKKRVKVKNCIKINRKSKTKASLPENSDVITKSGKSSKNVSKTLDDVIPEFETLKETDRKQSSDYSINAICKENQTPSSKDIDKVINEVVKEANPAKTVLKLQKKTHTNSSGQSCAVLQPKVQITKDVNVNNHSIIQTQNTLTKSDKIQKCFQLEEVKLQEVNSNENQNLSITVANNQEQLNIRHEGLTKSPQKQILNHSAHHIEPQQLNSQEMLSHAHQTNCHNQKQSQEQTPSQDLHLHSELSNDIFASLQVQGSQNPESTSPTAAFLNAFPLVSSFTGVKVTEVMEDETVDSAHGAPTLLQIGNMEAPPKIHATQNTADNLTPGIINLDNFNFFNNNLYNSFDNIMVTTSTSHVQPQTNLPGTEQSIVSHLGSAPQQTKSTKFLNSEGSRVCEPVGITASNKIENEKNMNSAHSDSSSMLPIQSANFNANIGSNPNETSKNYNINVKRQHSTSQVKPSVNGDKPFVYNVALQSAQSTQTNKFTQPSQSSQFMYDNSHLGNSSRAVVSSGINLNSTTNRYNEYNTFNPFELPKTTQSFVKNYSESTFVNNVNNCSYNYQSSDYNYTLGKNNYHEISNNCGNNFYNTNNVNNGNASLNSSSTSHVNGNKFNKKNKDVPGQSKSMVNWMAPSFTSTSLSNVVNISNVAKVTSYSDITQIGQNNYLNSNTLYSNDYQIEHQCHQDRQFAWSPTKLPQFLDSGAQLPHNFPSSTLPTLVGDLALGISYQHTQAPAPHIDKKCKQHKKQSHYDSVNSSNSGNVVNILSVSQLVDHNKDTSVLSAPARITNRRNSGNRNNKPQTTSKNVSNKKHKEKALKGCGTDWESKNTPTKNLSYSAESLIAGKQQNYPKSIPPYLPDNILPYFPHNLDDNFSHTQSNQSFHQNNSFPTNYNNSFIPSSTNTTYIPTSNFMPDMFEDNIFSHVNSSKMTTNLSVGGNYNKKSQKTKNVDVSQTPQYSIPITTSGMTFTNTTTNQNVINQPNPGNVGNTSNSKTPSKSKRKESFVDLSFLSLPSINSPLLPEDYHSSFIPPPPNPNQLYSSCKNPIYKHSVAGELTSIGPLTTATSSAMAGQTAPPGIHGGPGIPSTVASDNAIKPRAIQHPEVSPASGSLTNFNLCTIFPEINRTNNAVPEVFRNYEHNSSQKPPNYLSNT